MAVDRPNPVLHEEQIPGSFHANTTASSVIDLHVATNALGRSDGDGDHNMSLRSSIFSSVTSHDLRTFTVSGCSDENLMWEKDLIPFVVDLITRL